jgi:hypothetical protein
MTNLNLLLDGRTRSPLGKNFKEIARLAKTALMARFAENATIFPSVVAGVDAKRSQMVSRFGLLILVAQE